MARAAVSGAALAVAGAGAVMLLSGLRNAPVLDTVRAILAGEGLPQGPPLLDPPPPVDESATVPAGDGWGAAAGAQAVTHIRKYLGIPYVWAGEDPTGFDCSGLITWVLHHDMGIDLPSNHHTVTGQFYTWTGAVTVDREDIQPGDLICWMSHIAMCVSPGRMIHAPRVGKNVEERSIYWTPAPIVRRPKAYGWTGKSGRRSDGD